MTSNSALQARRVAAIPRGVATAYPVFAERAEGSEIWDVDGNRYVDFGGGIAVVNTGHRHPKVIKAVRDSSTTTPTPPSRSCPTSPISSSANS